MMIRLWYGILAVGLYGASAIGAEPVRLDAVSAEQATLERQQLASDQPHTFTPAMAEYRKTAELIHYPAGERKLPGYVYRPKGDGPHPAVLWNHGSEKEPRAQPEL